MASIFSAPMSAVRPSSLRGTHPLRDCEKVGMRNALLFSMAAVSPRQDADPQSSRTLLPSVIAAGFSEGGTADASAVGIIPSLTSRNNFINFCASRNNGALTNGSPNSRDSVCNPCPIGLLPAAADMPSVKITEPLPLAVLDPNQEFTIALRSRNFAFGSATNPSASFMTAPQQLSSEGVIIGHMHLVIESLDSFDQTTPPDPQQFSYFTEVVDDDQAPRVVIPPILGVGLYRATVSLHAISHQPITLPVLQRGATSDAVYFSIGNGTMRAFANDGQDTPQAG
ncbi:hypothetical protein CC1G_00945 [Coprinopsis cinerea okayama7|uniref:Uncharacterized protein n=1 Tax=Coprinopsis cinerea (strain Okayama-7 / 130 / ATCC MYA-4618 / FGSC 9003) TaxID=240176 RepID=A8N970_COPC7|nr:hypothetical protein CC1G_00945 [Coprinopsis cinerea okayama7\|eukprot:XP_001831398.2 hypothetical protein CC1G_00945 [Coprinopsis cinerea okayama7\